MLFAFEQDFSQNLQCIPMVVRYKLDRVGLKLKLHHWMQFSFAQRQLLMASPCDSVEEVQEYEEHIRSLILQVCQEEVKTIVVVYEWEDVSKIPDRVEVKAREIGISISLSFWQQLTPLQRFALVKLSQGGHENRNFLPALKEFGFNQYQ